MRALMLCLALALGGCVIAPPRTTVEIGGPVYPYPDAYWRWDPSVRLWFFFDGGHRRYAHRGFEPQGEHEHHGGHRRH